VGTVVDINPTCTFYPIANHLVYQHICHKDPYALVAFPNFLTGSGKPAGNFPGLVAEKWTLSLFFHVFFQSSI